MAAPSMGSPAEWVDQYGYAGLFVWLVLGILAPLPDETVLLMTGYLVDRGTFRWLPASATAFMGSVCGITISYTLGRELGWRFVQRIGKFLHVHPAKLEHVRTWFEQRGKWLLPLGYFVPGVRHWIALVAGSSRMRWPVFATFAYAGALVWSQTFVVVGYALGAEWKSAMDVIVRNRWLAVGFAVAALCIIWSADEVIRRSRAREKAS